MNLADPELELIDPTPNIHNLFILFDKQFFWTKLASRAVVRWSKRMYSCAGICSYEGRGGLCDIALSEPLLKLRPRKDLVETLLHEMIHAFLFVTSRDQDRDGHGPNFQAHMHRINKSAGLNISIYHDFHDEVKLYQTHWWRCNGPCQTRKPYFGIVRRSRNQVPGPNDFWWAAHQKGCGGTFVKIKEPIKQPKKAAKSKANNNADITKYITNNNNKTSNKNVANKNPDIGVLKDCSNVPIISNAATKSNSSSTVVVTKKGNVVFNPKVTKPTSAPIPFSGNGQSIRGDKEMRKSLDVIDTVRNVWTNKQLSSSAVNIKKNNPPSRLSTPVASKQKNKFPSSSPPIKIQKIDNYFKTTASSILKDVYGEDFNITESDDNKLKAVNAKNFVDCPICSRKVDSDEINKHLDVCLNTQVLEQLSQSNHELVDIEPVSTGTNMTSTDAVKKNPCINKDTKAYSITDCIDLTLVSTQLRTPKTEPGSSKIHSSNEMKPKVDLKPDNIKPEPRFNKTENIIDVKVEPTSVLKGDLKACPCCGKKFDQPVEEHLEECLGIFNNDCTIPEEGASTSYTSDTIDIDNDEDMFDETLTLNATGTKCPCPCCLQMVEAEAMNEHLDDCLR